MNAKYAYKLRSILASQLRILGLPYDEIKQVLNLRSKEKARAHAARGRKLMEEKIATWLP